MSIDEKFEVWFADYCQDRGASSGAKSWALEGWNAALTTKQESQQPVDSTDDEMTENELFFWKAGYEACATSTKRESQKPVDCVERVAIEIAHAISMLPEWSKKGDLDQFPGCRDLFLKAARAAIAATPARESVEEWQPPHEWHHYGMGIVRSRLMEDRVYLQGKNGDVWRVQLEMDGLPIIECIERNAKLPTTEIEGV